MKTAAVIGTGPAGLMAAETLGAAGLRVTLYDHKPSPARKLLMAGKSGLNLTKAESAPAFLSAFAEAQPHLRPMLAAMGAQDVTAWAEALDQEVFVGSTGRVFPKAMKASPLLRAWLARLDGYGVSIKTRWRWTGWSDGALAFDTPDGERMVKPDVTVLALGGASWARLGSDGHWTDLLGAQGVELAPFAPANAGIAVEWTKHMTPHLGGALKGIALTCGPYASRGEAVLSERGLEGGGVYSVSRGLREGHSLTVDLVPDLDAEMVTARLSKVAAKTSLSNTLRKALKLDPAKSALLHEMAHPLPQEPAALATLIKALPIRHSGLRPIDEAISTAGGVAWSAVDETLMLRALPGVFVAGEMLDWEAPTGGYLITACLATGRWAGQQAAHWSV